MDSTPDREQSPFVNSGETSDVVLSLWLPLYVHDCDLALPPQQTLQGQVLGPTWPGPLVPCS